MKRWLTSLFCLLVCGSALALSPNAERRLVVASMLVTGSITVAPDGSVKSYVVDHPGELPAPVISLIAKNAPTWRFKPVVRDGQPIVAQARMSLRIVARPVGDGNYALGIRGSYFGQPASWHDPTGRTIGSRTREPPRYPMDAARAHVSGTVYLIIQVNRAGLVEHDAAEQVNLGVVGSDSEMRHWRNVLAEAAVQASRRWTFVPPTVGPAAERASWNIRVPVAFRLNEWGTPRPVDKYGSWHAYVPGPQTTPAWAGKPRTGTSADAVAAGAVFETSGALRLTTPLNGA